jgi:hypothetical protein
MKMRKVFITNHIEHNAVTVTARDEYDRVLAEHKSILGCNRDVTGALLVSLIDVMHKLSAGNNIKLVDFDLSFTNNMVYRCRVWRKFNWNVYDADRAHRALWEELWHLRRFNKIYTMHSVATP